MQGEDIVDTLRNRVSCSMLEAPGPDQEQLKALFDVAARAADHALLRPWRFLVIEGEGLEKLGELYLSALEAEGGEVNDKERKKALGMPLRAPLIVVAIQTTTPHDKVPEIEQILSTGASVQNMLNAAFAMGLGAIWRTGPFAYNEHVMKGLGLAENERIVAFLYLGTPKKALTSPLAVDIEKHVKAWP